jgi:hypothetical protein
MLKVFKVFEGIATYAKCILMYNKIKECISMIYRWCCNVFYRTTI